MKTELIQAKSYPRNKNVQTGKTWNTIKWKNDRNKMYVNIMITYLTAIIETGLHQVNDYEQTICI